MVAEAFAAELPILQPLSIEAFDPAVKEGHDPNESARSVTRTKATDYATCSSK